jgi:molybdopterin/thiamine biosynthesis adenylyltransferase
VKVSVIGLGNIGSPLARLLAALLRSIGDDSHEIVFVDHDVYDPGNLVTQIIDKDDVGRNKAIAQARKLRGLNPKAKITAFPFRLEHLPLGMLANCDAVFTCLDSKAARVAVNERVWKAGVPAWIDTGVSPDRRLARVTVFKPGGDAPCLICGWGEPEFASLEVVHPCGSIASPSTGAPAALGCLAASLAVLEFEKVLCGESDAVHWNREIVVSASSHTHLVTSLRRDAHCRFDHQTLALENGEVNVRDVTLGSFWERFASEESALRIEGGRWLTSLVCGSCRASQPALVLRGRGLAETAFCAACGSGRMLPSGFHQKDAITREDAGEAQLALPLCRFGIRPREIVTFIGTDLSARSLLLS